MTELPPINNIELETKFVIVIEEQFKIYYVTKVFFKIASEQWTTLNIDEIPKNMLFDTYEEAEKALFVLAEQHYFIKTNHYKISIKHIYVLKQASLSNYF